MRRLGVALLTALTAIAERGGDGSTPLLIAAYRNDEAEVRRLLRSGADSNAANDLGATPLWAACLEGNLPVATLLLDAGANPNAALLPGETPLMVAARGGWAEIVEKLLAKGANPEARATRGQTALMWAAAQRRPAVVKLLIGAKADIHSRSESWTQMMAVPPHGYPAYNRLVPHGADTALLFAARSGDLESAKLLAAAGANVDDKDAQGVSATMFAAHSGFTDLAEFLLERGADPNADGAGFSALHIAIHRRDERLVRALLEKGANPEAPLRTWTPTRRSSRDFHFEPQLVGATPYWLAARFQQPEAMRLLAAKGANPKVVHRAAYVVEKGFKKRSEPATAPMAAVGMVKATPWVQVPAARRESLALETVKAAVELGADVSAVDDAGRTALDGARAAGWETVVRFLEATRAGK